MIQSNWRTESLSIGGLSLVKSDFLICAPGRQREPVSAMLELKKKKSDSVSGYIYSQPHAGQEDD